MLDKYLEIAHREQEKLASMDRYVQLMMKLPEAELHEMAKTGHIKVGYFGSGEILGRSDEGSSWLDHFKGTPLHAQAIALLEEELKMQVADDQRDALRDQERSQNNQQRDSMRLQKRLLELELVKQQSAADSAALPPPAPSPGMGAPPGMGAQGAGAPGDMAPEGAVDGNPQKMAAAKEPKEKPTEHKSRPSPGRGAAFLETMGDTLGSGMTTGGALGGVAGALHGGLTGHGMGDRLGRAAGHGALGAGLGALLGGAATGATTAPGAAIGASTGNPILGTLGGGGAGYMMGSLIDRAGGGTGLMAPMSAVAGGGAGFLSSMRARPGIKARAAHDEAEFERLMAEEAASKQAGVGDFLRAAAPAVGNFVKEHPGAAIGGGLGALHGLIRQDGGVGSAVLEGAGGAALGHGAQHLYQNGGAEKLHGMLGKLAPEPASATASKEAAAKLLPFVGSEKRAFGAFLGAIGGALAGAGARSAATSAATGALGAGAKGLMAGGLKGLATTGMNWAKTNPMKAVGGAMNAASNFAQARQQGYGMGGSALSGLAGGASALG